jgi:hypothetical protein
MASAATLCRFENQVQRKVSFDLSLAGRTGHCITSLDGNPQELYDQIDCACGNMENRFKAQHGLTSTPNPG